MYKRQGPKLAAFNRDLIAGFPFAGSYASLLVVYSLSILLASFLRIPPPTEAERYGSQRPLKEIIRQPVFFVPAIGALTAYGVMNLVTTSTPLAMAGCDHSFADTAFVIEWHGLAMFLSFSKVLLRPLLLRLWFLCYESQIFLLLVLLVQTHQG